MKQMKFARLFAFSLPVLTIGTVKYLTTESDCKKAETPKFLNYAVASNINEKVGTPTFVYDEKSLRNQASKALSFPNSYGLTVRYAMKASSNAAILKIFHSMGISIDASSGYEAERAMLAGIPPENISLSSQQLPHNFVELISLGVKFNACSLRQLEEFGKQFPGKECGIRFNPGAGSGGTQKTNVGGPSSSFGIWYEKLSLVKEIVERYNINVVRLHTHIGSGSDPDVWQKVSNMSLQLVKEFPNVHTLNLGGGYKVGRMSYEYSTDMKKVGLPVQQNFERFAQETGRQLHLEIEPGTFLVANAGSLLCQIEDLVSTGEDGYKFAKLNTGMTEVLRPSLYGAQHPIVVLEEGEDFSRYSSSQQNFVVVGHCCESGDLFSCAPGECDVLQPRNISSSPIPVRIGDFVTIDGAGAYCSSMSTKNYNSYPEAPEVLIGLDNQIHIIRKKQTLAQMIANECPLKELE